MFVNTICNINDIIFVAFKAAANLKYKSFFECLMHERNTGLTIFRENISSALFILILMTTLMNIFAALHAK